MLAMSVASGSAQTLGFSPGATLEGALTDQALLNSATGGNDGTISTWVVNDSTIDPYGYIFIYQLENSGPDEITGVNFNNFTAAAIIGTGAYSNVFGSLLSASVHPTVTLTPSFTFDTVTPKGAATFNGGLDSGAVSWFEVIDTDVNSFADGYGLAQDNFQAYGDILAQNYALYVVPEPPSRIVLLAGLACFYGFWRCCRRPAAVRASNSRET